MDIEDNGPTGSCCVLLGSSLKRGNDFAWFCGSNRIPETDIFQDKRFSLTVILRSPKHRADAQLPVRTPCC